MTEKSNDTSLVGRTAPPPTSSSSSSRLAEEHCKSARNDKLTTPLNHFENYLQMKSTKTETSRSQQHHSVDNNHHDESTDAGRKLDDVGYGNLNQYNHFTAPFKNNILEDDLTSRDATTMSSSSSSSLFTTAIRSQTFDRFANIFMERMGEAMSSGKLSQAWGRNGEGSNANANGYALERDMVKPHITPIVWGSSCVILTLVSMRCGRWYEQQHVRSLWGKNAMVKTTTTTTTTASTMLMRQQRQQRHPSLLEDARLSAPSSRQHNVNSSSSSSSNAGSSSSSSSSSSSNTGIDMTVPVDISLSLLFGISTSIFLTDKHRLLHDFAHAPLLVGKSVLAEELCIPFQKEMMEHNHEELTITPSSSEDFWQDENLGEFDSLRAIRDFVIHCHMRDERRVSGSNKRYDDGKERFS